MSETLKRMGSKLLVGAVAVGALLGYKFYQRSQSESETRAELITICEADAACKAAVDKHFATCHETAYRLGGRRQAGGLDSDRLTSCINAAAGTEYFATQ
jgi:hypothetical protein